MADKFVQGVVNHATWMMVDATDFASPESAMSAATKIAIRGKLLGNTGLFFVTSGVGSLTNDIIHAGPSAYGTYTIALATADLSDASAVFYDQYILHMSAVGAALQTMLFSGVRATTSDILSTMGSQFAVISNFLSNISDIVSNAYSAAAQANSRILLTQSMASDAVSALTIANSRILLNQSRISDMASMLTVMSDILSDFYSDFQSRVPKLVATNSQLSDLHSDLRSYLLGMSGMLSDVDSALTSQFASMSDVLSDFNSDLRSLLITTGIGLNASTMSDLRSAIAGVTATLSASDISDIASAVQIILSDTLSNILSAATQTNSRALVIQSLVSDVSSALTSRFSNLESLVTTTGVQLNASMLSDLRSAITAVTATVSASDISDIASAVRATLVSDLSDILSAAQQGNSRILVVQSMVSNVDSAMTSQFTYLSDTLSDLNSDLRSLLTTTGVQLNTSMLSDLRSAIAGVAATIDASAASDIASAVWAHTIGARVDSRILLTQSRVSDVQSYLVALSDQVSDLNSDLRSLLTTTGITLDASTFSDLRSVVLSLSAMLSDTHSAATVASSRALLIQSQTSDIDSALTSQFVYLSDTLSDLNSDLRSLLTTTGVQLNTSMLSDLRSAIAGVTATLSASDISDIASAVNLILGSRLSDILSAAVQTNSRVLLGNSMMSDVDTALTSRFSNLESLLGTTGVAINASAMSDVRSAIAGVTATINSSDISDLASAVDAILASRLSDILSAAQQTNSRALVVQSLVSDVDSALTSRFSDLLSLLNTTGVAINASSFSEFRSVMISDISDIASAVNAILASRLSDILSAAVQTNSRALLIQSMISDVDSALSSQFLYLGGAISDAHSDLASKLGDVSVTLTASDISDIASAVAAAVATVTASDISDIASAVNLILASRLSDILSAAQQTNSRALVLESMVSDVDLALSSQFSDLASKIGGMTVSFGASEISDIASAVYAILASDLSDLQSRTMQINSRVETTQSQASDIYSLLGAMGVGISDVDSALTSQFAYLSDTLSDLRSDVGVMSGVQSDIYSLLSDLDSNFTSRVPGRVLVRADAMAELGQAKPSATPTLETALMYTYMGLRNKAKTTGTERQWFDDAGVMITKKPIAASGGSYLESEVQAGT